MSFTKWIRKNKQTIMVAVLVLCMLTFVGGVGFTELLKYLGHGSKITLATYDTGKKITNEDLFYARQDLDVLKAIQADIVLFNKPNAFGMIDINSQLLGYLLFGSDSQAAAQIRAQLRQAAQGGRLSVTTAQIDEYFAQQPESPDISWILLCAEASKAGIAVSNEQSAAVLKEIIPQLSGNRFTAAQVIGGVAAQMNLSNEQILAAYGKLLGVLKWAEQVCNNEDVTLTQIRSVIGHSRNRIDAEFAAFSADWFIDKQAQPADQEIQTQFNMYKDILPGQLMDQNPYGFGYKLPKRVQLEFLYVRDEDAKKTAQIPTAEAMEEYYSANISQFTESIPVDPNKPEGDKIDQTKSFAEVSDQIRRTLEQQNTEKLTQLIFKDARELLDTELIKLDMSKADAREIQKAAMDYGTIAARLTEKYKVPVQTGKTGLLSAVDFGADEGLAYLWINKGGVQTPLNEAVFAMDPENKPAPPKLGVYVPRIWENIGPLKGYFSTEADYISSAVTIICRVVDVRPSEVPSGIDLTYSTAGIIPSKNQNEKIFNLKDKIVSDLRTIAAMNDAKAAANEFKSWIAQTDWDKAVEKYNSLYAPKDPNSVKDKGFTKLTVTSQKNQLLASASDIAQFRQMMQDNPSRTEMIQSRIISNMLNQELFDLLGDKQQTDVISEIIEHKAGKGYYVVKSVALQAATMEDYTQNKSYAALRTALDGASEMGLLHLNPENIRKRMNYSIVKQDTDKQTVPQEIPSE